MTRAKTDKAQSLTTTRTVTCHSRVTKIEEEDWVDYVKRITNEAIEKWEMRRIDAGTRRTKNEMETGDENCHITEREMVDKSC